MIAFQFGNLCFDPEETVTLVIAPKSEYKSTDNFLNHALDFLETDIEFGEGWSEMYNELSFVSADNNDINEVQLKLNKMRHKLSILHEPIIKAFYIVPPKWNDISLAMETKTEYIFYNWGTTA